MTSEITSALFGYFEALYNLNRNLITLCGVDVIDNFGQYETHIAEIIQDIPRLVPYVYDKENETYIITKSDGLLEFSAELPFLKDGYDSLLEKHYEFLKKVKTIRNKFEHKMHGARLMSAGSGSLILFDMTYMLSKETITLQSGEIIRFVKQLNSLFSAIQQQVETYYSEKGRLDSPYCRRLIRYDFSDFNKIYDSPLLKTVGKALFPF